MAINAAKKPRVKVYKRARASPDSPRPYRLWDADAKRNLQWRYYSASYRAHIAALIECKKAQEGFVVEVYNAANGALLGQYKRLSSSVAFFK